MAKCVIGPNCPTHGAGSPRSSSLGPAETAAYGRPRPKSVRRSLGSDAIALEIVVSEMNAMTQRLANELEAERNRSRLDGRQVIADRKRERRRLISQVARHGIGSL